MAVADALSRAADRLNAFQNRRPDAVRLARLASLAVRIEPALIRELRVELLPDVDVGAEADLWFSPLVESRGTSIVLQRGVLQLLREHLATEPAMLERAALLTARVHAPLSAPIRLEEQVIALTMLKGDAALPEIDEAFQPALRALKVNDARAQEVARWMTRAAPALPSLVWRTPNAYALLHASIMVLGGGRVLNVPAVEDGDLSAVAWALPPDVLSRRIAIGVELFDDALQFVEPISGGAVISMPPMSPPVVDVRWRRGGTPVHVVIDAVAGRVVPLGPDASEVKIRTVAGATYIVSRKPEAAPQATAAPKEAPAPTGMPPKPATTWRPEKARVLERSTEDDECVRVFDPERPDEAVTGAFIAPRYVLTSLEISGERLVVDGGGESMTPVRILARGAASAPLMLLESTGRGMHDDPLQFNAFVSRRERRPDADALVIPSVVRATVAQADGPLAIEARIHGVWRDGASKFEIELGERELPRMLLGAPVFVRSQAVGMITALKPNLFGAATVEVTGASVIQQFLASGGEEDREPPRKIYMTYADDDLQRAAEIRTGLTTVGGFVVSYRQPNVRRERDPSTAERATMEGLLVLWSASSERDERIASDVDFARKRRLPITFAMVGKWKEPRLSSGETMVDLVGWEADRTSGRFQGLVEALRARRSRGDEPYMA